MPHPFAVHKTASESCHHSRLLLQTRPALKSARPQLEPLYPTSWMPDHTLPLQVEPLPADSPLWKLDNVLMAPHTGGVPPSFWEDSMRFFVQQIQRFARGEALLNVVDKQRMAYDAAAYKTAAS